jgi:hypothetical protein
MIFVSKHLQDANLNSTSANRSNTEDDADALKDRAALGHPPRAEAQVWQPCSGRLTGSSHHRSIATPSEQVGPLDGKLPSVLGYLISQLAPAVPCRAGQSHTFLCDTRSIVVNSIDVLIAGASFIEDNDASLLELRSLDFELSRWMGGVARWALDNYHHVVTFLMRLWLRARPA